MNIAIIGLGWVGKKIKNELLNRNHTVYEIQHGCWIPQVCALKLDYIVNCAGYTGYPNVDACENEKNLVYNSNVILPLQIYNYCQDRNIKLAHFSSGCIYEGNIKTVYANPNFFGSTYSISKGISDNYLKWRCLLFRIRMPFTAMHEQKNFISKVYKYAIEGKLFNGGQNSLTNLDEAIIIACNLIESNAFGPYNLVNQGSLNMRQIINMMGVDAQWFDENQFKSVTKCGRSNCIIPAYEKMSDIESSMMNCIVEWKNNFKNERIK